MNRLYPRVSEIPCISSEFTQTGTYYDSVILKASQQSKMNGGLTAKLISYAKEELDKLKRN